MTKNKKTYRIIIGHASFPTGPNWYVGLQYKDTPGRKYLHRNLVWKDTTEWTKGIDTGYYNSRKEARETLDAWYQQVFGL